MFRLCDPKVGELDLPLTVVKDIPCAQQQSEMDSSAVFNQCSLSRETTGKSRPSKVRQASVGSCGGLGRNY